jgi:hypothetical protein
MSMNGMSPSEAALEGFRLTRERFGVILAWCGVYFVGQAAIGVLMISVLGAGFIEMLRKGPLGGNDVQAVTALLEQSWPAFLLVLAAAVALMSVITAGIYRLVLRPDEPGFAHLRLGGDELRIAAVSLMLFGVGIVHFAIVLLAVGLAAQAGAAAAFVMGALMVGLTIWLGVRLSMVTPMTFALRKITIAPAWALTHGRFWPLFGMMFLAVVFYIMIWLLIVVIITAIVTVAGGEAVISDLSRLTPASLIAVVATAVMQAVLQVLQIVMIYAPIAVAYRQLHGDAPARVR